MTEDGERRIHERLDDLSQRIASIDKNTAKLAASCEPCKAMVHRHDGQINGNGGVGLRAEVIGLTGKLRELHEDRKEALAQQERTIKWQRVQLGAVITTMLGVVGMAAKYFFG